MARPTIYNEEILIKAREYLVLCKDNFEIKKVKIPTKGGLARHLDVARETLYDWATKYSEFSDIMEEVSSEQEDRLINNGLSGDYNSTIAKVLLTKHGYSDKQETDITTGGEKISVNLLNFNGNTDNSSQS